jgi:hypothetical protein
MGVRISARPGTAARREGAAEDPARTLRERKVWGDRFGAEWVSALRRFSLWAREEGIPVQSGSPELLCSALARSWGWGAAPPSLLLEQNGAPAVPGAGGWVLRVPPGLGSRVRERLDSDAALAAAGRAPSIVIEETSLAHLPSHLGPAPRWPSAEGWLRGGRIVRLQTRLPDVLAPQDSEELVNRLRESMPAEEALMAAWDVWRAGTAWDRNRASYWLLRHAAGYANREAASAWRRRAADWGVRVLEPDATGSGLCARIENGAVRLGWNGVNRSSGSRRWQSPVIGWWKLARVILGGVAGARPPRLRARSLNFT